MNDKEAFDLIATNAVAGKYPNWTNEQRCELMQVQLPASGYRADLEKLHADMLAEIARLSRLVGTVRAAFNRECDDADAILRTLGLDPENCRTDGGSLMLQDILETLKHCDAMLRYEARLHKDRADDCGRLARMVLDCCPTAKCTNPARDCYGSGCLSDEPQSAVAAAYGGLTQTAQG